MALDAEDRAMENLISQYHESENLKAYLRAIVSPFNDMLGNLQKVRAQRSIEGAQGTSLNLIGDVVGAERVLRGGAGAGWFGYYENAQALGTGTVNDPTIGGTFYDLNLPISNDLQLDDAEYRKWIYARILLNSRNRSVEVVIEFIKLLFLSSPILPFTVEEDFSSGVLLKVRIDGTLSPKFRSIFSKRLSLIRPAGVPISLEDNSGNIQLED